MLYNVPPEVNRLEKGVSPSRTLPWGGIQGGNDFDRIGYRGPCPSEGKTHRYVVRAFALKGKVALESGAARDEVLERIEERVLEETELMGRYRRLADR